MYALLIFFNQDINLMKKIENILWLFVFLISIVACDDTDAPLNGYVETTQEGAETLVLKGYENANQGFSVFQPTDFESPFYITEKCFYGQKYVFAKASATRLDAMTEIPVNWNSTVEITENSAYWVKYASFIAYKYIKMRVILIEGNNVTIEYVIDKTEERPNTNANTSITAYATNWEMPSFNADNYFVAHAITVSGNDVLNYAYEWNATMKHAQWVAFSFDETTKKDVTGRTDAWDVDPLLPVDMQTTNSNHTNDGFDRGHICASEDRVWSKAANEQTFYFSNLSPQLASFNQGFWVGIENQVRKWGRATPATYDKVYVTKGGTLNHLLVNFTSEVKGADGKIPTTDENGFTIKGLPCPQYYYAAVLSEKAGQYKAIAFLVEHKEGLPKNPTAAELQACVVSIDELEEMTGLDFFCNLPDDLENEVEKTYDISAWAW